MCVCVCVLWVGLGHAASMVMIVFDLTISNAKEKYNRTHEWNDVHTPPFQPACLPFFLSLWLSLFTFSICWISKTHNNHPGRVSQWKKCVNYRLLPRYWVWKRLVIAATATAVAAEVAVKHLRQQQQHTTGFIFMHTFTYNEAWATAHYIKMELNGL